MRAFSRPAFDSAILLAPSEDRCAELESAKVGAQRPRHKLIIGLWLLSVTLTSVAWLAGLTWASIWLIRQALS
jgi:hypothetical protein